MINWLKETLIGLAVLLFLWLLCKAYIIFITICSEDSKRGEIARKIRDYGEGIVLIYMVICSFVIPIVIVIVWLCS